MDLSDLDSASFQAKPRDSEDEDDTVNQYEDDIT